MPEVKVTIGHREFEVACQAGEEHYLQAAAKLLDVEATAILGQIGRLPEARMLLMAGLMLADKTAGMEEQLRAMEEQQRGLERSVAALQSEIDRLKNAPPPEPERVEVPVIPPHVADSLAELAARAESVADKVEERAAE